MPRLQPRGIENLDLASTYTRWEGSRSGVRPALRGVSFEPISPHIGNVIRIAISQAAFDAIAETLPFGSVGYENETTANGERLIWLPRHVVDKLSALRGRGESYSDAILRLASEPR